MAVGDEVKINHDGDKDDGLIGTIVEITTGKALVQFDDGSGGWYALTELAPA